MRVGICTLMIGHEYKNTINKCTQTQVAYASKHSYDRITDETVYDPTRPISWSKIHLIKKYLKDYDYLLWMDADVMVINSNVKIETFLMDEFLLLGRDLNTLNCGMMLLRNCPKTFEFLDDVWSQTEFINHPWWEQAAVIHLYPKYKSDIKVIPRELCHTFNAYDKSIDRFYPWVKGDWVVHFAGLRGVQLRYLQDEYFKICDLEKPGS